MMMDALQMLIDEVALEGLDGITIPTLWIRLENRNPKFPPKLDPATKEYLWKALVRDPDIEFYALPKERAQIVLFDRFAEIDPETGIQEIRGTTPSADTREDVYPVHVIQENKDGVQGSCLFFKERKNITSLIRTEDFKAHYTLEDAFNKWGEKLVVVASQIVRYRALIGPEGDPGLKLADSSYCILERLGRARWQGELQRDLHSRAFKMDAGKMHYLRKSLDRNGLITLQSHVIRLSTGGQQHSILLLLKRFHVDRRSKYDILMEKTSNILAASPGNIAIMIKLREQLCVSERTFKRVYQYMMAAKLVQIMCVPLKELNPDGGPCKTKRGTDIMVRCLKLLKEYGKKEEDDDDENDEEDGGRKMPHADRRVMERDMLMQAYELIVSSGTKGISQSALRGRMNVGKLEGRMICRLLERNDMIKGFMEDEGRQRTTKYISKVYVEQSDLNRQFVREQARSEKLRSGAGSEAEMSLCTEAVSSVCPGGEREEVDGEREEKEQQPPPKCSASKKRTKNMKKNPKNGKQSKQPPLKQIKVDFTVKHSTPIKKTIPPSLKVRGDEIKEAKVKLTRCDISEVRGESDPSLDATSSQTTNLSSKSSSKSSSDGAENDACVTVIEEIVIQKQPCSVAAKKTTGYVDGPHQTYRLLKRKNLIIEAVRSLKIIDSLYTLQKMIMDEEKQDGVSTKCCKKSIMRLLRSLSREGMLKVLCTTIIQDGISKKVEFVVHPSISPDDPLVRSAIEQIRFRISSSYSAHRMKETEEEEVKNKEAQRGDERSNKTDSPSKTPRSKTDEKMGIKQLKDFRPSIVPGLGRSRGFQPKMLRLRLAHSFLWYLIYGHPLRRSPAENKSTGEQEAEPGPIEAAGQTPESTESSNQALPSGDRSSSRNASSEEKACSPDPCSSLVQGEEGREIVYVDDLSWKRYIPLTPLHREFGYGWALTSDILLSLPLSVFVQIIQVNYQVDGLDIYLNDPVKQHFLIRFLPGKMKRQLLYKRKYIFSVYESMQRLCYMGLLQFGPTEKFQDKDQVFVYVKRKGTIVDTTTCEPHYNLAVSARPFERRSYTFNTLQDVENFWFDLQCVCLNTPLGVIRCSRSKPSQTTDEKEGEEQLDTSAAMEPERPDQKYSRIAYTLKGSADVTDDGVIPGDGLGAGGLDSCFFAHLKRNWIWTSYLLSKPKKPGSTLESNPTLRLNNLLTKHSLPLSMCGGSKVKCSTDSKALVVEEEVQITTEPSSRNSRVVGGKKQKRKRLKTETVKEPRKRKRAGNQQDKRIRLPFHDEADLIALKRMTRQRVAWTLQEDSLLLLCRVASHFLNRKIRKPFVPWQVVRDLLHAQFEESLDKTSLSVGRRSRYIMKNPQTYLNFRICLAEVYQDKSIIEEFQNRRNNYEDPEVCASEFKEFVAALKQKFSDASGDCGFDIPDSKEELFKRFKVYAIGEEVEESTKDDLTSYEDIHALVLNNLIQSTLVLSNSQMKICRSFQTFHMYSRYNQDVLYQAFLKCQRRGLVNRRRVHKVLGPKKSRALPFMPMSYQLSQSYYRCFSWRIPNTICTEAYQFLEMLWSAGREDRPNTFIFQDQESAEPESVSDSVLFPLDASGGSCVAALSLMIMGLLAVDVSIPEQIVVVDSTMMDNEVVKSIVKDVADEDEDDEAEEVEGKRKIEVKARQASHTNYLLMRGYCVPGIVSLRNLNTNDNVVVNSCTVRVKLRSSPAHGLFTTASTSVVDDMQRGEACLPKAFTRLIRPSNDSSRLKCFSDWCITQCGYSTEDLQAVLDISSAIEEARAFGCDRLELSHSFSELEETQNGRTRSFQQYMEDLINLEEVLEVGGNSVRLVAIKYADPWLLHTTERLTAKSKGFYPQQATPRKRSLQPAEEELTPPKKRATMEAEGEEAIEPHCTQKQADTDGIPPAEETVLPVEVEEPTTSTAQEAVITAQTEELSKEKGHKEAEGQEGLTQDTTSLPNDPAAHSSETDTAQSKDKDSSSLTSSVDEKVSFVSRPWRIVDGGLNRPVCKGMLESLLYHIMSKPGITEPLLVEHYKGVLQPVVVLDLLKALEEMGCVLKRYIKGQPRASLFSPAHIPEVKDGGVKLRDNAIPFYEPTVDCCLRLGKIFPQEANWNKWVHFIHT
ncbi:general transcription factor 3C polypeptide 1-like isoform X1 [Megalops cyprinoides]|uniref:general transcription factor 3C polypeptide 1-like isoform X1 n=1 Tax=Megalops cyprinoides TaxID=118141 RepID=UPI0018646231|nr:general transcription factor 3C polypeptide 1-like isoform X1 [Megalops cyprinoides]